MMASAFPWMSLLLVAGLVGISALLLALNANILIWVAVIVVLLLAFLSMAGG